MMRLALVLIPRPVHRALLRLAHRLRRIWWTLARPDLSGCRIIARDSRGHILLIRHSYGSAKWMLPGGGIARREGPLAAALRELREETGLELDDARILAVVEEHLNGAANRVHLVCGQAWGDLRIDRREVIEARFFDPAALPGGLSPALAGRLEEWLREAWP